MEVEDSNVGSPEWIEGLKNGLITGLARLQDPPPPRTPLDAASHNAIGHLVQIEQELRKGRAASPVVVTNADRLRRVYYDRLIALGRLGDALEQRSEDDALYSALAKLDRPAPSAARQSDRHGSQFGHHQIRARPRRSAATGLCTAGVGIGEANIRENRGRIHQDA